MKKLTNKELKTLKKIYERSRQNLLDTIIKGRGVGTKTYYNEIYRSLEKEIQQMQEATAEFVMSAIPREYEDGLQTVYDTYSRTGLQMKRPDMWAKVNYEAVYGLARELQLNIDSGLAQVGRQILRYANKAQDEALRTTGLTAAAEKIASGRTIVDMKKSMIKQMQEQGFMTVQYGSGSKAFQVPLDTYAMLCARSTTAEATNIARENQLVENGYDLVEMTTHYPTCEVCAMYEGRVYSISGKDTRFPALYKTAFKTGYRNVHPNCRHAIVPYIEELATEEEKQKALEVAQQPFEDKRTEKQRKAYEHIQRVNYEFRRDLKAWELHKQETGKLMSFGAFRKKKAAEAKSKLGIKTT